MLVVAQVQLISIAMIFQIALFAAISALASLLVKMGAEWVIKNIKARRKQAKKTS